MAWLAPAAARGFDVLLSSYDPEMANPGLPGVFFEVRAGRKVSGYAEVLRAHETLIARYDYVALFDDDLMINAAALTRLFEIVAHHGLKIAQPALTHDSHFTYAALLQDTAFELRYVNYIEMMCPVFRKDVLPIVRPLFSLGYESGIDLIWCNLTATSPADFAVIDAIPVRHTRAVGSLKAANGFTGVKRYEDDIYAILAEFKLPWLSCVPFSGIRRSGMRAYARTAFLLSAFKLIPAIFQGPGWRMRARSFAVYVNHLLRRRPQNIQVRIAQSTELRR